MRYSVGYVVLSEKSAWGFEPAVMVEPTFPSTFRYCYTRMSSHAPSGRSVADEWYMRGMVLAERPSRDHLLPFGAAGS